MKLGTNVWRAAVLRPAAYGSVGLLALSHCWTAGCSAPSPTVAMWTVPASAALGSRSIEAAGIPEREVGSGHVQLSGAKGETVDFCFAVRASQGPAAAPLISGHELTSDRSVIKGAAIRLFRMYDVHVAHFPGWHVRSIPPQRRVRNPLDVLVPVDAPQGGAPAVLLPRQTYAFWADIHIPRDAAEGNYSGEIALYIGGAKACALPIDLTVLPFALPEEPGIPVIAELDHARLVPHDVDAGGPACGDVSHAPGISSGSLGEADILSACRVLREHGLTPVLHRLTPRATVDAYGGVVIEWSHYDSLVSPLLDGRAFSDGRPVKVWPLPFHPLLAPTFQADPAFSQRYAAVRRSYLAQAAGHFSEKGWLDRGYLLLPDEFGSGPDSVVATRALADVLRQAEKRVAVVARSWPQDLTPYGWVDYPVAAERNTEKPEPQDVAVWLTSAQFYDRIVMADERIAGKRTWFAVDRPPFSGSVAISAPPAHARVLLWQAAQLKADAVYLGCVNRWPCATDRGPGACAEADPNVLIYPGEPFGLKEPVSSVRLKILRRSMQDVGYRQLSHARGLEHAATAVSDSLSAYAGTEAYRTHFADGRRIGWVDDERVFNLGRRILADALTGTLGSTSASESGNGLAANATWRRFMLSSRRLHMSVDGTRVRLPGPSRAQPAECECSVTITNRLRVPVSGTLAILQPSQGGTSTTEGTLVADVAPAHSRSVTASARWSAMPVEAPPFLSALTGVRTFPIEFSAEDGTVHNATGRLSLITAAVCQNRRFGADRCVDIDGDLSDWPVGSANVASGFRLIAEADPEGVGGDGRVPELGTTAFVLRDAMNLYIAVQCDGGITCPGVGSSPSHNRVHYDDLVPTGDDLVEILIDPLNAGTRSPGDLYHIAVKPSGSYVCEKGLPFDPPCGQHAGWGAEMELATSVLQDRWTIEARIPLSAFEGAISQGTIWGFNVTRYDPCRQEFSTWSGATGNAYDPLSAGNLYMP